MPAAAEQHHPPWQELACALVEARRADAVVPVHAVVCPSADGALAPRALRHLGCCALLRTRRGTVWMLRANGHPWTEARLAAAESFLVADEERGPSPGRARTRELRIARALELPQVRIATPALDAPDPAQWDTRRIATAVRLQHLAPGGHAPQPSELAAQVEAIEAALVGRLRAALEQFVATLDQEVLAAMPASGGDGSLYCFLADPAYRRNRLQLAATFPLFVRAAATGERGSAGALIRATVDAGRPLIDALARHWAVSRSVLRGLRQRPVEVVGRRWETNLDALVAALDALPPEFRPGADPAGWRAFNEHMDFAESVFGRRPWTSPLALAWLRHAARQGWSRAAIEQGATAMTEAAVAAVETVRAALVETLKGDSAAAAGTHAGEASLAARAWLAVDRCLAGMTPRRLDELAQRYRRELAAATAEPADENAFVSGAGFWPLLPGEYLSGDRLRLVVPLMNAQALQRHGAALRNCLGRSHLAGYAAACRHGGTFIVAVLDAATRAPLSTAEVLVNRPAITGTAAVRLAQHTAAENREPSAPCRLAVHEAVALARTARYQQHLREGFRAIAGRRRGEIDGRRQAQRLAVRRAVGEGRYAELLRLACEERSGVFT